MVSLAAIILELIENVSLIALVVGGYAIIRRGALPLRGAEPVAIGVVFGLGAVLAMTLREAVTNVIRHAAATRCAIEIAATAGGAQLCVTDNGRGGSFREGNGLTGMRQRLAAAGGTLSIHSGPGGTRLVADLPA